MADISLHRIKVCKGKPLLVLKDKVLVEHRLVLFWLKSQTLTKEKIVSLPSSFLFRIASNFYLLKRILRLGVKNANYFRNNIYFTYKKAIYSYSVFEKNIRKEIDIERGSGPLNMSVIENVKGFEDCICFGDYFKNDDLASVNMYYSTGNGLWERKQLFKNKTINHVHNLIPDPRQNCVWILTGDFNQAAGIWKAVSGFSSIKPCLIGSQQYRACWAFPTETGLLYATDTQFENNNIRLMVKTEKNDKYESKVLYPMNGPCIYACMQNKNYVFSTSTEPGASSLPRLFKWFSRKRGPGIVLNESHLVVGSPERGFSVVLKNKKDFFPYRLFQFGAIYLPTGKNDTEYTYTYSIANKNNGFKTEVYEIK